MQCVHENTIAVSAKGGIHDQPDIWVQKRGIVATLRKHH
jgi:hypothetical protein